jgi:hypothetical protein
MNRPLWLDFFYIAAFFAPPTLVAALGAFGLSSWLELPAWAALAIYAAFTVLAIILWIIGLVAWNRMGSPQASDDLGADHNGNRHGQN